MITNIQKESRKKNKKRKRTMNHQEKDNSSSDEQEEPSQESGNNLSMADLWSMLDRHDVDDNDFLSNSPLSTAMDETSIHRSNVHNEGISISSSQKGRRRRRNRPQHQHLVLLDDVSTLSAPYYSHGGGVSLTSLNGSGPFRINVRDGKDELANAVLDDGDDGEGLECSSTELEIESVVSSIKRRISSNERQSYLKSVKQDDIISKLRCDLQESKFQISMEREDKRVDLQNDRFERTNLSEELISSNEKLVEFIDRVDKLSLELKQVETERDETRDRLENAIKMREDDVCKIDNYETKLDKILLEKSNDESLRKQIQGELNSKVIENQLLVEKLAQLEKSMILREEENESLRSIIADQKRIHVQEVTPLTTSISSLEAKLKETQNDAKEAMNELLIRFEETSNELQCAQLDKKQLSVERDELKEKIEIPNLDLQSMKKDLMMTKDEAEKDKKRLEESLSLSKDSVAFLEREIESTQNRLDGSLKDTAVEKENAKVKDKTIHSLQVTLEQVTTDFQLAKESLILTKDKTEKDKKSLEKSLTISKDTVASLDRELQSTQKLLEESQKDVLVEKENAKVKDEAIHTLQASLEQVTADLRSAMESLKITKDEAENDKQYLEDSLSKSKDMISSLEDKVQSIQNLLDISLKDVSVEKESTKVKDQAISSLQESLEQVTTDAETVMKTLEEQIDSSAMKVKALRLESNNKDDQIKRLQETLRSGDEEILKWKNYFEKEQAQLNSITISLRHLNESIGKGTQNSLKNVAEDCNSLNSTSEDKEILQILQDVKQYVHDIEVRAYSSNNETAALQKNASVLEEKCSSLENTLARQTLDFGEIVQQSAEKEIEISALEESLKLCKSEHQKMHEEYKNLHKHYMDELERMEAKANSKLEEFQEVIIELVGELGNNDQGVADNSDSEDALIQIKSQISMVQNLKSTILEERQKCEKFTMRIEELESIIYEKTSEILDVKKLYDSILAKFDQCLKQNHSLKQRNDLLISEAKDKDGTISASKIEKSRFLTEVTCLGQECDKLRVQCVDYAKRNEFVQKDKEKLQVDLEESVNQNKVTKEKNEILSNGTSSKDADIAAGKIEISRLSSEVTCLCKERDDLRIQCGNFSNRNTFFQNDLKKLHFELEECMKKNQALMEETSVKDADIAAGKHEISRLSSEVTRLCQERDDVRIQFVDVANRNEFVLNELEKLQVDLEECKKQNQALMEETSVKDGDIDAGKLEISRLSSEVTCLCQERDDIRIQFDDVVNSNESVQNELEKLQVDLKESMKQNQVLMEETSVKDADIDAGKLEISRLSSEVTCLCQERDDLRIQFADVANSNESVQNELEKLQVDLKESMKRNQALVEETSIKDGDIAVGKLEISRLSSEVTCLGEERDDLRLQCSDFATKNESIKNTLKKLQIELEDSTKQAQLIKERNEALSDAVNIKDSDVAAGKLELSQLSSEIMCLRKEYDDLRIKCSDCANRNEFLQNDLEKAQHDLDNHRIENENLLLQLKNKASAADENVTDIIALEASLSSSHEALSKKDDETKTIISELASELQNVDTKLEEAYNAVEELRLRVQVEEEKNYSLQNVNERLHAKVEEIGTLKSSLEKELNISKCRFQDVMIQLEESKKEMQSTKIITDSLRSQIDVVVNDKNSIVSSLNKDIDRLACDLEAKNGVLTDVRKNKNDFEQRCAELSQALDEERKTNAVLKNELLDLRTDIRSEQWQAEQSEERCNNLRLKLEKEIDEVRVLTNERNKVRDERNELKLRLSALEENMLSSDQRFTLKLQQEMEKIQLLEKDLSAKVCELKESRDICSSYRKTLDEKATLIGSLQLKCKRIDELISGEAEANAVIIELTEELEMVKSNQSFVADNIVEKEKKLRHQSQDELNSLCVHLADAELQSRSRQQEADCLNRSIREYYKNQLEAASCENKKLKKELEDFHNRNRKLRPHTGYPSSNLINAELQKNSRASVFLNEGIQSNKQTELKNIFKEDGMANEIEALESKNNTFSIASKASKVALNALRLELADGSEVVSTREEQLSESVEICKAKYAKEHSRVQSCESKIKRMELLEAKSRVELTTLQAHNEQLNAELEAAASDLRVAKEDGTRISLELYECQERSEKATKLNATELEEMTSKLTKEEGRADAAEDLVKRYEVERLSFEARSSQAFSKTPVKMCSRTSQTKPNTSSDESIVCDYTNSSRNFESKFIPESQNNDQRRIDWSEREKKELKEELSQSYRDNILLKDLYEEEEKELKNLIEILENENSDLLEELEYTKASLRCMIGCNNASFDKVSEAYQNFGLTSDMLNLARSLLPLFKATDESSKSVEEEANKNLLRLRSALNSNDNRPIESPAANHYQTSFQFQTPPRNFDGPLAMTQPTYSVTSNVAFESTFNDSNFGGEFFEEIDNIFQEGEREIQNVMDIFNTKCIHTDSISSIHSLTHYSEPSANHSCSRCIELEREYKSFQSLALNILEESKVISDSEIDLARSETKKKTATEVFERERRWHQHFLGLQSPHQHAPLESRSV